MEERIVNIRRKIKNKLAALLLGNDFVILTAEEHETYISMKHEYERKLAECEQMIQSLQVEQNEYEYLKHLADTLVWRSVCTIPTMLRKS